MGGFKGEEMKLQEDPVMHIVEYPDKLFLVGLRIDFLFDLGMDEDMEKVKIISNEIMQYGKEKINAKMR